MTTRTLMLAVGIVLAFAVPNASARMQALPPDITAEATAPDGAVVSYAAEGFTCTPGSGSTFHLGPTTVSCADAATGTPAGTFIVTVVDRTPPAVTPPANVTMNTGNPAGTAVGYGSASATDAVAGPITPSCSPASGSNFPVGTTTVTCSASDGVNTGTAAFTVTVNLVDTTAPAVNVPGPITADAAGPGGASVPFSVTASDAVDPSPSVSCNHASGETFPLGTTTVSCTATDASHNTSAPASFTITVVDRGPPTVSVPGTITKEATGPSGAAATYSVSAVDAVDPSPTVSCDKGSGATFPVGTTVVSCTARDASGNTSPPASFAVKVVDTTAPQITPKPADITAAAAGVGGAVVTFSLTAADLVDPSPSVSCDHSSGSTFPIGTTAVSCTAKDASGNTSGPATFNVSVVDRGAPTVIVPGPITKEAAGPSGASVAFTVSATDAIDPSPAVSCSKSSGATFPVGTTQVSCTAKDASNNTSSPATFNVNVVDTTAPQLTAVPADITAEANSPGGSKVNFVLPTAVDSVDGPLPLVACDPAAGSTFPLGTKTVTCSASDSKNNQATASFKVKIVDTTPPKLIPPGDASVYATTDAGSYANDDGPILRFLRGAHASDIADPKPTVVADFPDFFGVGTTTVKFAATDAGGNKAVGTAKLTVLPKPSPGTTPPALPPPRDNKPPANVSGLGVKSGDGRAKLTWTNPSDSDFDHTEITRSTTSGLDFKVTGTVVYRGKAATFTDRGLRNGVEYRYVVATVDKLGNASAGMPIVVVPKKNLLRTPADGGRLKKIPAKFIWTRDPRASYYNLQLYSGGTLLLQSTTAARQKILSVFPTKPVYNFRSPWKWQGRKYTMTKGFYAWYVWPGYGPREDVNYGPLLGSATFQVAPAKRR